ncbi:hypothetical protein LUZ60_000947 [Juncus effusus]|nr:hypothetical protein LUZ60_000947 [Juncus effusus]
MGRRPCCAKEGLNRGAWTALEDEILVSYIKTHGEGKWRDVPQRAGLKRCGKSCRLRWLNYLRPDIKRGNISHDEEELIIRLHKLLGNRWSLIAGRLPGRTDNEIKNYWNTTLGKRTGGQSPQQGKSFGDQTKQGLSVPRLNMANDSTVVRTKAVRCTKSIFPLGSFSQSMSQINHHESDQADQMIGNNTRAEFKDCDESREIRGDMSANSSLSFDETVLLEDLRALASFLDLEEEWLNLT